MSASEQTSASKREPGYYWVHFKEHWGIALWNGIEWFIQDEDGYHYYLNDEVIPDVFDEIDERRIERGQPDELSKAQARVKELEGLLLQETGKNMKYQHALQNIATGSMPYDVHDAFDEMRNIAWNVLNPKYD